MRALRTIRRCIRACAAACAGAMFALSGPSAAFTDIELVHLIAAGHITEARALFATNAPTELDWLFFDARVAKAEGRLSEAAVLFRDVLRRDPTCISARRELAHTLLLAEEYRASVHHFSALLASDPDPEQRRGYIHFLNEIDHLQPHSFSGSVAIVTSSNINRGSSRDTFHPGVPDLPSFKITSDAEPGTGLELGLAGRHLLSRHVDARWVFDWRLSAREFDNRDHDSASAFAHLTYGKTRETTRWSIAPSIGMVWKSNGKDRLVLGLDVSADWRMGPDTTFFVSGRGEHSDDRSDRSQDGPFYSAQIGIARSSYGGVLSLGTRLSFHRPQTAHQRYDGLSVFAHFARAWPGGFHGGLELEYGQRDYAAEFPLAGVKREDAFVQIRLTGRHDAVRIGQFTPAVDCTFGVTSSNVAFYDYDLAECGFRFERRF